MCIARCRPLVELGESNVGAQCLRQCCNSLGVGFGIVPFTEPFLQVILELTFHGDGTSIFSALANLEVGEATEVYPSLAEKLVNG